MTLSTNLLAIEIRSATLLDVPELAHLRWEFHQASNSDETKKDFVLRCTKWLESALSSGQWQFIVASEKIGSILGFVFLQLIEKVPSPGEANGAWGYVTNSYIRPSHRGAGIGGLILEKVITKAKSLDLELLLVWPSVEAASFYRRYGFEDTESAHDHPEDYPPMELVF